MTVQGIKGGFWLPNPRYNEYYPPGGYLTVDTAGEKLAYTLRWPKSGNISKLGLGIGTVTTSQPVDVRVETLDSSGNPSGSLYHANAVATGITLTSSQINWIDFTDFPVTMNDRVAVQLSWTSDAGSFQWNCIDDREWSLIFGDNYVSSWTKHPRIPVLGLEYDDGCYPALPLMPIESYSMQSISTTATVRKVAMRFRLPMPATIKAVQAFLYSPSASTTSQIRIYDDNGNAVSDAVVTSGETVGTYVLCIAYFPSVAVAADTYYKIALEPLSSAYTFGPVILTTRDSATAYGLDCFEGGRDFHYQDCRSDGWQTEVTYKRPQFYVLFDGFDSGTRGGRRWR